MALAFVLSRSFLTSAIIGATDVDQLEANLDGIELTRSNQVLEDIEAIHRRYPGPSH